MSLLQWLVLPVVEDVIRMLGPERWLLPREDNPLLGLRLLEGDRWRCLVGLNVGLRGDERLLPRKLDFRSGLRLKLGLLPLMSMRRDYSDTRFFSQLHGARTGDLAEVWLALFADRIALLGFDRAVGDGRPMVRREVMAALVGFPEGNPQPGGPVVRLRIWPDDGFDGGARGRGHRRGGRAVSGDGGRRLVGGFDDVVGVGT